ncbi:MAG: hypothetical protein HFJ44_06945 [Clostridia bacterium]|jgi:hypothetical protein|nr:hypothetical protein [Clostridia bacterium]
MEENVEKEKKSKIIKKYIFISFLALSIIISTLLIVKYNVEGEKNLPFEIEKISIKSSLDTKSNQSENIWDLSIIQNNDIYIYFKKNEKLDSEVQKIRIENLKIKRNKEIGQTKLFIPTSNDIKTNFKNSTEDYSKKGIEYTVNNVDNMEKQEISQNGGMIAFRISNQDLAEYISNEEADLQYDGTLLQKAGITEQDIKITASMDIIIEISKKEKYKGTLTLELPIEDFNEKSILGIEKTDLSDVIFKRSE